MFVISWAPDERRTPATEEADLLGSGAEGLLLALSLRVPDYSHSQRLYHRAQKCHSTMWFTALCAESWVWSKRSRRHTAQKFIEIRGS
jgi:hypothetical protein